MAVREVTVAMGVLLSAACGQAADEPSTAAGGAAAVGSAGRGNADDAGATNTDGSAAALHVCRGSYTIEDADDVAAIQDCTTIAGNLSASSTMLGSLDFPALVEIEGFFNCQMNSALSSLSLPELTTSGHIAISGNDALTTLNLPSLTAASGMTIYASRLETLSLPELASVAGEFDFSVVGNTPLTSLSLPKLATVEQIFIVRGTQLLTNLTLPALATVGAFRVDENGGLANLTAPALTTVKTDFLIRSNPALPTCQAQALGQQLTNFSGMASIVSNDDAATCD